MERLWDNVDASLECLPGDVLSYVFEFLVSGLEEVASLARVSRFFQICVKRPNVVRWLQLSTHARLRQTSSWDKEAASAQLVATLRQVRSGCPSITGVNLGCMFEAFDDIQYVTNEHVRLVAAFPKLERVSLSQCAAVTKVRPLQSLETLTYLNLQNCTSIPKAGFSCLSSLVSLQELEVQGTYINDEGLEALSRSPTALTQLGLGFCRSISVVGFACLSSMTSLLGLDVRKTYINDEGLEALSGSLTALTKLNLWGCSSISAPGFACLSSLTSLQELNVRETDITDNGLEILSGSLTELAILDLCACKSISGQAFACLSSLTSLQDLNLNFTDIVDEGLAGLSRCVALTNLSLYNCRSISGPGFTCLSSLVSLQHLNLYDTSINARVLGLLKKALQSEIGYDIR